jgi:hypothetical protein
VIINLYRKVAYPSKTFKKIGLHKMPINIINAAVSYKSKEKKIDLTVSFDQFVVRFTID